MFCPVDGSAHSKGNRCENCGWGLNVIAPDGDLLFEKCPYDGMGLVIKERLDYAKMARYVCTSHHCLFEIVQRM